MGHPADWNNIKLGGDMLALRVLLCIGFSIELLAGTYYVRTDGNDSNAGTSNTSGGAWLTAQKAGTTITTGDTVYVQPGTYSERVTISNNGGIFVGTNSVVVLGFQSTDKSDYSIIGFEITHPGAESYEGIRVAGTSSGVSIVDNSIHDVGAQGIRIGNASNLVIRGNSIANCGQGTLPLTGSPAIASLSSTAATNVTVEYNSISYVSDFVNPVGTGWVIRNNSMGPSYETATVHIDGMQNNDVANLGLMEANYSIDNASSDNHFYLNQISGASNWVLRGNVTIRSNGLIDQRNQDYLFFYRNSFIDNLYHYSSTFQILYTTSTINFSRNNIWWKSVSGTSGPYSPNSSVDDDFDIWFASGTQTQANGLSSDPLITSTNNARLQVMSPAIGAAGGDTKAAGAATDSTTLIVTSGTAGMFYAGDNIKIGSGTLVSIDSVDHGASTITLSANRTWSDGDDVLWEGRSDIGALPYGSTELTSATISQVGNDYTVTPAGAARGVWFYVDGVPTTWDSTSPYSATIASGTVTAKAYALYAQETPSVAAGGAYSSRLAGKVVLSGGAKAQ